MAPWHGGHLAGVGDRLGQKGVPQQRVGARRLARASDARRASGRPVGRLEGIPVGVKDIFDTADIPTENGCAFFAGRVPERSAAVVRTLEAAGAIVLGKTNMDEFGMGSSCENSALFNTHNPWDLDRVPGGSSGGSAAAMSASLATFTIGEDTGGSVRMPAGFCGVTGLKTTYGRVSRYGLIPLVSSFDTIGPMARSAY